MRNLVLSVFMGLLAIHVLASGPAQQMKIEQVMTLQEMRDTGVTTLTAAQRHPAGNPVILGLSPTTRI